MTRAEVTLLIQQKQQLPLSACLCGVCGADYIGWLGGRSRSLGSVSLHFPQVPHGTWAVLYVAAPHTAPLDPIVCVSGFLSIVRGGRKWCSRWGGEMGMPLIHPAVGICCCCFSTAQNRHRTLRTCSSAKGRAKRLRLCMAWHGMAGCLVCMARWGD